MSAKKVISYNALRRARTTIEDFVQSYLPLHGLSVPEDFYKYLDILVFVEGAIYEMDEENEVLASKGSGSSTFTGFEGETIVLDVLRDLGLLNYNIRLELIQGKMYWQRERDLCSRMAANSDLQRPNFSIEDVHSASEGKSFDYRLLNYLLYSIRKVEPDRQLIDFLFLDEHLVDIGDDLHDYEEDVLKNSFNIYRAYIHIYGSEAEQKLVERISEFEARHEQALQELPAWAQHAYKQRRREASVIPGSEKWIIPQPIYDEHAYRERMRGLA